MNKRHEEGFSLIEVMVVVMIIAIIVAIGVPAYLGFRQRGQDTQVKSEIANGAKVEAAYGADGNGFTDDAAALALLEPSLDFSGANPRSLHVKVQDVQSGDNGDLLIYARSNGGTWFGMRLVDKGADAGRYTCSGDAESDVDDFADCTGTDW